MKRDKIATYGTSLLTVALLSGCPNDDDIIGTSAGSDTTETGTTDAPGDGDPGDGDPGDGDPGDGDPTGDGDGDPGDGDGDPTGDGDGDPGDGDGDPGDGDGDPRGPLEMIPEEEWVPVPNPDGVPSPLPGVYEDIGVADENDGFRSLIGLDLRNRDALADLTLEAADPTSNMYGNYLTTQELLDDYAPTQDDFDLLQAWLDYEGLSVNYLATNRMLIQFTGTVGQFNDAFNTTLHVCMRDNPQQGNPPIPVYCTDDPMTLPLFVANRSPGIVTCDLPAEVGQLPNEAGQIQVIPPNVSGSRLNPDRVARAYNVDDLYQQGYDGTGQTIGVVMGAMIHYKWAQTFWQSWGIVRPNPTVIYLMEDPVTRYIEAQLDNTWSGAIAPGAEIIGYEGPDSFNTSMVFAYNEAVTRAQDDGVSVITNSFAHREDSEPQVVRNQYDDSSLVGSALGITLLAATGDSGQTDTPSGSPWCTGVGGTRLILNNQGNVTDERAWNRSGSGITLSFDIPDWQVAVAGNLGNGNRRVVADLSAAADTASPYYVYYNSQWSLYGGTSFASPVVAGIIAVVNQYRDDHGMAPVGYLNPMMYTTPAVQQTFRDITVGCTADHCAGAGWDPPSGWGTPDAEAFAMTVPSP